MWPWTAQVRYSARRSARPPAPDWHAASLRADRPRRAAGFAAAARRRRQCGAFLRPASRSKFRGWIRQRLIDSRNAGESLIQDKLGTGLDLGGTPAASVATGHGERQRSIGDVVHG